MALFKLGSTVTECRGKLGGSAFQMNAGRCFAFNSPGTNANPSLLQLRQRNAFTTANSFWKSLTAAQQKAWIIFAKTFPVRSFKNSARIMTTKECFFNSFMFSSSIGLLPLQYVPAISTKVFIKDVSVICGQAASNMYLVFTRLAPANTYILVHFSRPMSVGHKVNKGDYTYGALLLPQYVSPYWIYGSYIARFPGSVRKGFAIHFRIVPFNNTTGVYGLPIFISSIVQS